MSRRQFCVLGSSILLLFVSAGCGTMASAAPERNLVPVSGTVLIDGKPAEDVYVSFVPAGTNNGAHPGWATTDADGHFKAVNFQGKRGLPQGEYIALMTLWLTPEGKAPPENVPPAHARASQVIPARWNNPAEAGKHNRVIVPEGGITDLEFKIKSPAK